MENKYRMGFYYEAFHSDMRRMPEENVEKVIDWLQNKETDFYFRVNNDDGADLISKPLFVDVQPEQFVDEEESDFGDEVMYQVRLAYGTVTKTLTGVPESTANNILDWAHDKDGSPYFHCVGPEKESYISRPLQMSLKESPAFRRRKKTS